MTQSIRVIRVTSLVAILSAGLCGTVHAATLFEFSRDSVFDGIQPDSVYLRNLSDDTLVFDTVYTLLDTNCGMWIFDNMRMMEIPLAWLDFADQSTGQGHTIECRGAGPALWYLSYPAGSVITANPRDSVLLWGFILYLSGAVPPEWYVPPTPDSANAALIFVTQGQSDTLHVCRRMQAAAVRLHRAAAALSCPHLRHDAGSPIFGINGRVVRHDVVHGLEVLLHGTGGVLGGVLSGRYNAIDQRKGLL
jgi:hypothetical protein